MDYIDDRDNYLAFVELEEFGLHEEDVIEK